MFGSFVYFVLTVPTERLTSPVPLLLFLDGFTPPYVSVLDTGRKELFIEVKGSTTGASITGYSRFQVTG